MSLVVVTPLKFTLLAILEWLHSSGLSSLALTLAPDTGASIDPAWMKQFEHDLTLRIADLIEKFFWDNSLGTVSCAQLIAALRLHDHPLIAGGLLEHLKAECSASLESFAMFVNKLDSMFPHEASKPRRFLREPSILGVFVRLHQTALDSLTFAALRQLQVDVQQYLAEDSRHPLKPSLNDSDSSAAQTIIDMRKLISGSHSLTARDFTKRAETYLRTSPHPTPYYLAYLNCLKSGETQGALDFLQKYYDYYQHAGNLSLTKAAAMVQAVSSSPPAGPAAIPRLLNFYQRNLALVGLYFSAGHFERARLVLDEAIQLAQVSYDQRALVESLGWLARVQSAQHVSSQNRKHQRPVVALLATYCLRSPGNLSNDETALGKLRFARHVLFASQTPPVSWIAFSPPVTTVLMQSAIEQRKQLASQLGQPAPLPAPPASTVGLNLTSVFSNMSQEYRRSQPLTAKQSVVDFSLRLIDSAVQLSHEFNLSSTLVNSYSFASAAWRMLGSSGLSIAFAHLALQRREGLPRAWTRGPASNGAGEQRVTQEDGVVHPLHLQHAKGEAFPASVSETVPNLLRLGELSAQPGDADYARDILGHVRSALPPASATPDVARALVSAEAKRAAKEQHGRRLFVQASESISTLAAAVSTNASERSSEADVLCMQQLEARHDWSLARHHTSAALFPAPVYVADGLQSSACVTHEPSERWEHYGRIVDNQKQAHSGHASRLCEPLLQASEGSAALAQPDFALKVALFTSTARMHLENKMPWLAMNAVAQALEICKKYAFVSLQAEATLLLAAALLEIGAPSSALHHVENALPWILAHGGVLLQADANLVLAQCRVRIALGAHVDTLAHAPEISNPAKQALLSTLPALDAATDLYALVQNDRRLAQVAHLKAMVFHWVGYQRERNEAAEAFLKCAV